MSPLILKGHGLLQGLISKLIVVLRWDEFAHNLLHVVLRNTFLESIIDALVHAIDVFKLGVGVGDVVTTDVDEHVLLLCRFV